METPSEKEGQLRATEVQLDRLQQGIGRLIDSYARGLISKEEFEPRIANMRERIKKLEIEAEELADQERVRSDLRLIVTQLEEFSHKVRLGLEEAGWDVKREVIRALVKHIDVGIKEINVVFRIDPRPFESSPERGLMHFCLGRQPSTNCVGGISHSLAVGFDTITLPAESEESSTHLSFLRNNAA